MINTFYTIDSSALEIQEAGEQLLLKLLNSKSMSLDDARFSVFEEKVLSTSINKTIN